MRRLADIDPFAPEVVEDPREFFAALRREAPLYELPNRAYFLISRYEDVRRAVMSPEIFSSNLVAVLMQGQDDAAPGILELPAGGARSGGPRAVDVLAIADPPVHTRQRKIANQAFSLRRVAGLEDGIRELTEELVAHFLRAAAGSGGADWVRELAVPLPVTVIADLIGLPREDLPRLKAWSDDSVALLSGIHTPEELARHAASVGELIAYLAARFDAAAEAPGDDVLGDLARATRDPAEPLDRDEAVSILIQILTAGNETTTSLIGSAVLLLLRDPALERQLRDDTSLIAPFIEEVLRLESPFHGHFRVVRKKTEVAGLPLAAGSRVMLLWASANRDEREFERPDEVDLERPNLKAHLGFGLGIHHCIGAALARLEARVAVETLLARTSALRLAEGQDLAHVPSLFIRSLRALHVEAKRA